MALRIPQRRSPELVTLPEARNHIRSLEPNLDRDEIAIALLEAAGLGQLTVYDVPDFEFLLWRRSPGIDWDSGRFCVSPPHIPYTLRQFYTPLVELKAAVAIFEEQPESGAVRQPPGPQPKARAAIKQRIIAALRSGRPIINGNHEAVTAEFGEGASRTTCVAALRDALSEFAAENSDKP